MQSCSRGETVTRGQAIPRPCYAQAIPLAERSRYTVARAIHVHPMSQLSELRNPFTYTGALRLDHPLFRGRVEELARLEQAALSDLDFFLLVYGGRQNGKTTLLLRLEARLLARREQGVRV